MKEALRPPSGSPIIGGWGDFGIVFIQSLTKFALRRRVITLVVVCNAGFDGIPDLDLAENNHNSNQYQYSDCDLRSITLLLRQLLCRAILLGKDVFRE